MNRYAEIENFLKYYASLYQYYPNEQISTDTIYYGLMNYGVPNEEINKDQSQYWENWINNFVNRPNLNVYHDMRQDRFLQFMTPNLDKQSHMDFVKLYLTFPNDKIEQCVNEIFSFVEQNNMVTMSKVSMITRSDSVVLRLANPQDAKKVMDYVATHPSISNNARSVNPFLMRSGKVGIASDDLLSFNSTLSDIIALYLQTLRNSNNLMAASFEGFQSFVTAYYANTFENLTNLTNFINLQMQKGIPRYRNIGEYIVNYKNVVELIGMSLNPNANELNFFDYYSRVTNEQNKCNQINYFNGVYNQLFQNMNVTNEVANQETQNIAVTNEVTNQVTQSKDITAEIDNYIITAFGKYPDILNIAFQLKNYAYDRSNHPLTNYKNAANNFKASVSPEELRNFTDNNVIKFAFERYYFALTNSYIDPKQLLDSYLMLELKNTKDIFVVMNSINNYLSTNNAGYLLDNFIFQEVFQNYVSTDTILHILNGKDLKSYISEVYANKSLNEINQENQQTQVQPQVQEQPQVQVQQQSNENQNQTPRREFSESEKNEAKSILEAWIIFARDKYGDIETVKNTLYKYMDTGNVNLIDSEHSYNALFATYVPPEIVEVITLNNLNDYCYAFDNSFYYEAVDENASRRGK